MKTTRRILSMLLCLALVLGFIPAVARAVGETVTEVTSVDQLEIGAQVIFTEYEGKYALGSQNGDYRNKVDFNNSTTVIDGVVIFTVEAGTVDGSYAFKDSDGNYLYYKGSKNTLNKQTTKNGAASWTIDIVGGETTITNVQYTSRELQYNSSSPRFACYEGTQKNAKLWLVGSVSGGGETPDPTPNPEPDTPAEGGSWILVTDASTLKAGDQVIIVAKAADNALSKNQKSSNRGGVAITKVNDTVTVNDDVQILTLENGTVFGSFAFNTGDGYLYASSSSSNQLKTQSSLSANASWAITITDGAASIIAQGTNSRKYMQYNPNGGSPLYACYSSASQEALSIYKFVESTPVEGDQFEKVTSADGLVSGKYIMVAGNNAAPGVFGEYSVLPVTPTMNGDICIGPAGAIWELKVVGNTVTLTDSNGVTIAPGENSDIMQGDYSWSWAFADGAFTFKTNDDRTFASNSGAGNQFRAYSDSTITDAYYSTFTLYKLVEETPAVPKVEKTSSRFGETLSLIFGYKKSELGDDYAGLTAYITKNGVTTPTTEWTTKTIDNEVYCLVELSGILAKEMTEQVSIVVKDAEGNVVTEEKTTSLREYAMSVLAGDFNNATKTMIVDMLNYGAAAQSYFKYNEDNLANALLEDSHKQLASELKAVENDRVGNVGEVFGGSALRFDDEISMIFRFKNTEGTYAKLTWKDHYGVDQTVTVQSTEYTYDEDGWTMIELNEKLVVADGRSNITCEIRNVTNDELVISVTDSIQAYVARSEGTDANALSVAFMKFSDSAKDYLANK